MIKRLEISGVHVQIDEDLRKYVQRKIGRLDKYIPRQFRPSVHGEVMLKEAKSKDKNKCMCEITLFLPREVLNIKESTINMYAAVDIVETKLKINIKKYKDQHSNPKLRRHLLARFRNKSA